MSQWDKPFHVGSKPLLTGTLGYNQYVNSIQSGILFAEDLGHVAVCRMFRDTLLRNKVFLQKQASPGIAKELSVGKLDAAV